MDRRRIAQPISFGKGNARPVRECFSKDCLRDPTLNPEKMRLWNGDYAKASLAFKGGAFPDAKETVGIRLIASYDRAQLKIFATREMR